MTRLETLGFAVASARWLSMRRHEGLLLAHLVARAPRVVRLDAMEGSRGGVLSRQSAHVYVSRLRSALADVGFAGCIETVRGEGWRFVGDTVALRAEVEARA